MTKSKFSISGFFFMVVFSIFSLVMLVSCVAQLYFSYQIIKFSGNLYFHLFAFLVLTLCSVPVTILNATVITIDSLSETISFKNIFSKLYRTYDFSELQGFVDTSYRASGGPKRVVYLIKDDKRIERIPEFYYANFDELKQAISSLDYMGERYFNLYDHLKILFRLTVFDQTCSQHMLAAIAADGSHSAAPLLSSLSLHLSSRFAISATFSKQRAVSGYSITYLLEYI